jgi:hypothetical protein
VPNLKWLESYSGQSVDELISLEGECRIDSLIVAFEQAVDQKAFREGSGALSYEEQAILAVEALEREVNNGGYSQFFINSSREYALSVVDFLQRIGCPKTAQITKRAIDALRLPSISVEAIEAALKVDSAERDGELNECDKLYYQDAEPIAERLFTFIKDNRGAVRLLP